MERKANRFDLVIVGAGIGGLVCAELLRREGYTVCVLEQNVQLGGALQVFSRNKVLFDSGVHYIGGCAPGQNLYRIFTYLGVMDQLSLEPCDEDAFDRILIEGDPIEYPLAQGYERFAGNLAKLFPGEETNIRSYCAKMREVCSRFPMYNLHYEPENSEKLSVMGWNAEATIGSFTQNETLRAVLGGNNILYAGKGSETPFHVHALIQNSYIESAWKFRRGGSQVSKILAKLIRDHGGVIRTRSRVERFVEHGGHLDHVVLESGEKIYGRFFISSLHPARTVDLVEGPTLRAGFRNRIQGLRNTVGCFTLNAVLNKMKVPYRNSNFYYHRKGKLWTQVDYPPGEWPQGYGLFFSRDQAHPEWAESLSIIAYMHSEEVAEWADSHHTIAKPVERPPGYETFKQQRMEKLLDLVEEKFPGLRSHIHARYASTPLTLRDYLGDPTGSMYGFAKDFQSIVGSQLSSRTRIRNLFLTGQNLNLHGVLGTTISALITAVELSGDDSIIKKVRHAH